MIIRYRSWQGIAAVVLSFSSTPVWAQLPSTKISPWNQLGRSWGFGVSDGYHECPECEKNRASSRVTPSTMVVSHAAPCVDCKEKLSFFSRLNPFSDSATAGGNAGSYGPGASGRMTVLPPSPNMYQQFAAPHETPLPGSNGPSNSAPSFPSPIAPENSGTLLPDSPSHSFGSPVPDPLEPNSLESPTIRFEPTQPLQPDTVPPPPVLRKRQKGDKPLGEENNSTAPREPVPAERTDEKPQTKSEESLDLLPKDEPPPITLHPHAKSGRSLISHTTAIPEGFSTRPTLHPHEAMLRQYYGQAYSRPMPPAETQPAPQNTVETTRSSLNRYR